MITRLRAQNFKSWRDTGDLRLAPLTGLFGANSSGKSSILQTLLLLRQTAVSTDPGRPLNLGDETALVDLGSFIDVLHAHDPDSTLRLSISWKGPRPLPTQSLQFLGPITFDLTLREVGGNVRIIEFAYRDVRDWGVSVSSQTDGSYSSTTYKSDRVPIKPVEKLEPPVAWAFNQTSGQPPADAWGVRLSLHGELFRLHYLGPLRYDPKRSYLWGGSRPREIGRDGELAIQALLASRTGDNPIELLVAEALKKIGLVFSFRLEPVGPNRRDYEVRIKTTEQSSEVLLTDAGFGISQILPILVLCYNTPPSSVLILEQPETHLHPAAQAELADVLMDVVAKREIQIIIESHSEHLLRRIQRRIAEEKFCAADAAIYFCEIENGESKATPLELTGDGFIKNWPKNFFGDEMGDLSAMTEAAAKRHLAPAK